MARQTTPKSRVDNYRSVAIAADQIHRQPDIIEQTNADIQDNALAQLPSVVFTANAAWLVLATIAFNLSRAIGSLTGADLGTARIGPIHRKTHQHLDPDLHLHAKNQPAPAG